MKNLGIMLVVGWVIAQGSTALAAGESDRGFTRQEDVIYGRKFGTALTMDVFRPTRGANGGAVVLAVSGGFFSAHESINPLFVKPLTDRGYTVFAVVHGSQPRYTVGEIVPDMKRAVRYIRHHAEEYGIDPKRIGATGASAGGHLSLMLGMVDDPGKADAKDPVDREPSKVEAVACFFPPTDLLNFGRTGNALIHAKDHRAPFRPAFDHRELDKANNLWVSITDDKRLREITRDISPIYHVTAGDAPTLIIHGDADDLVPLQQSELMIARLKETGIDAKLVVKRGAGHGWMTLAQDLTTIADWFDAHLKPANGTAAQVEARPTARIDRAPRKVIVGTVIYGPYGKYPGLDDRLKTLSGFIDEMASEAIRTSNGRGLDLAVLPESAVTSTAGPAAERAIPLEGPVKETFGALARKHQTYVIVPLDLVEKPGGRAVYSNAAVLFDRKGDVAGIYRKVHPVAYVGSSELEAGITPGSAHPVFDCDFGKLGIQICWDIQFDDGWDALAAQGAELVAWPSASPATAMPAARAARHRYYVVSSTWRNNATIYEPTGMVAARATEPGKVLVRQLDLSYAVLGWSSGLNNGKALTEKFGTRVGYHYEPGEDLGLFWSNDPATTIGTMIHSLGLEEIDAQVARNRGVQDAARGREAPRH
jgi:predicted amidohydrolase/acetyl esterase/lipase